eukprot:s2849_g7.t2
MATSSNSKDLMVEQINEESFGAIAEHAALKSLEPLKRACQNFGSQSAAIRDRIKKGQMPKAVIVANLVIMVLQVKNAKLLGDWSSTVDLCFLVFYCAELILKGFCYERGLLCGHCHVVWWNWLDLIIVLSGITELILPFLVSGHSPLHLSGLRGLRLLRLARLARGLMHGPRWIKGSGIERFRKLLRYLFESDLSWTQHQFFESLMMSVIVLNAIVMWLELDYPLALWRWVEEFFLVIYVFELCARLAYHGLSYFVHEKLDLNWTALLEEEAYDRAGLPELQPKQPQEFQRVQAQRRQAESEAAGANSEPASSPTRRACSSKTLVMDPTDAELAQIQGIQDAMDWAGVEEEAANALMDAMGGLRRIREVPLITRPVWDQKVIALQVPEDADPVVMGPPNRRALLPVELARVESFRRVCFLRMGQIPDLPGGPGPQGPMAGQAPFPPAGGVPAQPQGATTRKLKLSAILDPTLDADVIPMLPAEQTALYEGYRGRFGDFPGSENDPSPDQLAALRQVIAAGALPFACFTLFGPHGQRLLRRQTFTGYQLNVATGEWAKREQPGPSSYHEWHKCWRVYRAAMLLLDAADAERLDTYAEMIRNYVTQFTEETWFLVARADARMRSEQMERLRRELRTNPMYGYTEINPWSAVFMASTKDQEFWTRELVTPATLFLARHTNKRELGDTAPKDEPDRGSPTKKQKKTRPNRRGYTGDDHSVKGQDDLYVKNRRGIEICKNYNAGKCGSAAAQGKCKAKRSHQCNRCLGPHQGMNCPGKSN